MSKAWRAARSVVVEVSGDADAAAGRRRRRMLCRVGAAPHAALLPFLLPLVDAAAEFGAQAARIVGTGREVYRETFPPFSIAGEFH